MEHTPPRTVILRFLNTLLVKSAVNTGITLEERFALIGRELEGLSTLYGLTGRNLLKELSNSPQGRKARNEVKDTIKKAADDIRKLSESYADNGNIADANILSDIVKKVANNRPYVEAGFGVAVIRLMEKFQLPDVDIMKHYYGDMQTWTNLLSSYRNTPMHGRYFKIREGEHNRGQLWRAYCHLHDILVRIILKILCYDHTYQSMLVTWTDPKKLDWIKLDTSANVLGYRSK